MGMVNDFFEDGTFDDFKGKELIMAKINALQAHANAVSIICTVLALFFLVEAFSDYSAEWTLIAKKARNWLKAEGVSNADELIKLIKERIL